MIVNVDFAGLEWKTVLEWSQDPVGIREVLDELDAHSDNQKAFGLPSRLIAKVFLFRAIFRGKAFAYANDPDFMVVSKSAKFWQDVIDKFYDKYKGIATIHEKCLQEVYKTGQYVSPITGRIYKFKKYLKQGVWDYNDSEVVNFPVQGSGADIVAVFRNYCQGLIRRSVYRDRILLLATVHDSCVWDVADLQAREFLLECVDETFKQLANLWEHYFGFRLTVPHGYAVEAGPTYGETESLFEKKVVLFPTEGLDTTLL